MSADDLAALRTAAVRSAVTTLFQEAVAGGAALGWVDPPEPAEVASLLDAVTQTGGRGDADAALAFDGPTVVGFGYWRRYGRPTHQPQADLERVVVSPAHRGRGLGRSLVDRLVASAAQAGIEILTLDVRGDNAGAIALYEAAGFSRYGVLPGFVAVGDRRWDKVFMAVRLKDADHSAAVADAQPARTDHLVAWVVLQRPDGRVLLARRGGGSYGSGLWGLPGGHVQDDESLAQAGGRELLEEVGVRAEVHDLEPVGVSRYVDGPMRGTSFFFRSVRWQGEPEPVSECSQVGWFPLDGLPDDVLPWLPAILQRHLVDGVWLHDQH